MIDALGCASENTGGEGSELLVEDDLVIEGDDLVIEGDDLVIDDQDGVIGEQDRVDSAVVGDGNTAGSAEVGGGEKEAKRPARNAFALMMPKARPHTCL